MTRERIFCLSLHAGYGCRHSGACCTAGWPIPVERDTVERLKAMIGSGQLSVQSGAGSRNGSPSRCGPRPAAEFLVDDNDAPDDTPSLTATRADGACAFFEPASRLCAIHRQAGPALLPVACRQFPRVSLRDARGLFVTLSHFCPTAAAALFDDAIELHVVEDPPAFPADFPYDPLDATDALPPLLHPGVLLDLETYDRWERAVVAIFADAGATPEEAVARVATLAERLRSWTPGTIPLSRHFDHCLERVSRRAGGVEAVPFAARSAVADWRLVLDCLPEEFRPPTDDVPEVPGWDAFAAPLRRFLAAKAYGTWLAYQGRGLRSIAFFLRVTLSVVRVNAAHGCRAAGRGLDRALLLAAIRRTEEMLTHLAWRERLARAVSQAEAAGGRR